MKKAMYKSIKAGKSKFVQFFLTQEMNLKEFIGEDKETLRKLYSKVSLYSLFEYFNILMLIYAALYFISPQWSPNEHSNFLF